MSLRSLLVIALALLGSLVTLPAHARAQAADAPLPFDSTVLRGRLPNGMRYLVRRNSLPENRAELRLVVDAGSILEDDRQLGVAHFVEHMAFNGTRRFPKADLVNFLERSGVRFGPDLNAYTSFDETVYMLQVPTDTAAIVSKALDILEDWAYGLSLDSTEIRKERGVVVEEWRSGRGAQMRMLYKQFPVILHGSKYATRLPIGTRENLETFPDSVARAFYRDWYRPDLMTVVAVGDFEPKKMEADIKQRFARIPAARKPRTREYAPVPGHEDTYVSIESDKEYPNASVALIWFSAPKRVRTTSEFRRSLVHGFYDRMVNARLGEIGQRPDAPFAYAGTGRGSFTRTRDLHQLYAAVKGSDFVKAADALLIEAERVRRFGFTKSELDRARTNYLRGLEQRYAERDKTNSSAFAGQFVSSALNDTPILNIADEQALAQRFAPTITLEELNALARASFAKNDRVVIVAAPDKPEIKLPDRAAMLAVFDRPADSALTAYVDSTSDAPLIASLPTPGKIVSEQKLPETNILEWRLSNGAKVLLKPSDFKRDEVLFAAQSPGGISLLPDTVVTQAQLASMALSVGGLGTFSQTALTKRLTGKRASMSAYISDTEQGLQGNASAKDIETLFQLAWLNVTQPRVDSSAFGALRNQARSALANQRNDPGSIFRDTMTMVMTQYHPRTRLFTPELFDSVDVRRSLDIHRDRFSDASALTFFLVGSFNPDSVRPLVERYLASLPSTPRSEKAKDVGIRPPSGIVTKVVHAGIEPKAQNVIVFTGPCEYSIENRTVLSAMRELLNIRLREVLREDKSGTYGAGVSANCSHIPYSNYRVSVSFGSAPERTDELTKEVFSVIESIKKGEVSDSNMTKIRELTIRGHETALKQNNRWLDAMMDAEEDGRDQRDFLRAPDRMLKVTKEQIRDAARLYLRTDRYARFTLLPVETAKKPEDPKPVP
ncbi:MAG TPA: insulinase family protein [Gemmatimonadaceae bacterium]|nr:insulinase family protein [Gemmatimonadaceae bacterium]